MTLGRLAGSLPILVTRTPFDSGRFGAGNDDATSVAAHTVQVCAVLDLAAELDPILANVDVAFALAHDFLTAYPHPTNTGADLRASVIIAVIAAQPPMHNLRSVGPPQANTAGMGCPEPIAGVISDTIYYVTRK
jgi:hypothetical protein